MNDSVQSNPSVAVTPIGLNHLVLNVRDIEASHHFWTELLGFHQVGEVPPGLGGVRRGAKRFYSGVRDGRMHHHDIALVDTPDLAQPDGPNPIGHSLSRCRTARPGWAARVPQSRGVAFERRRARRDAQPVYPRPEYCSVELLRAAAWYGKATSTRRSTTMAVPTEGAGALDDRAEYPAFGR
jgi:catechol 2,3-dioxygenase